MQIKTFYPTQIFGSNMHLLISSSEAAVIDPSVSYNDVKHLLDECNIKYIFITHSHFDHILEIDDWKSNTDAEIIIGENEAFTLSDQYYNGYSLFLGLNKGYNGEYTTAKEGDSFKLGDEFITVIETPGHSIGGISLLTNTEVFVGDLLFAGNSYGRVDLPGGDYNTLKNSINKIISLSPDKIVYSGHGKSFKISDINMQLI